MADAKDFQTNNKPTWCAGCGDFGILVALKNALAKLGFSPADATLFFGIGCHGHMVNYLKTYSFEGLHGRALPLAAGAKFANHKLNAIALVGDGDQLGEGGNHFLHAARNNYDICCVLHNNGVYGLTVGQSSPTADKGLKSKSAPGGTTEKPVNPITLALAAGATFVARAFAGDVNHLAEIIIEGIKHRGFAFIDVMQPCVTFNHLNTYSWYYRRVYKIGPEHDPSDQAAALQKSLEFGEKIPLGVFYRKEEPIAQDIFPQIAEKTLLEAGVQNEISKIMEEYI